MPAKPKAISDLDGAQSDGPLPDGDTHLLVIAIDQYVHCPPLANCVRDGQGFVRLMQEQYQVDPKHTYTLFDEEATRTRIHMELRNLRNKVKPQDSLIVFFSGHGEEEEEEAFWVPVESNPHEDSDWITVTRIKQLLSAVNVFHLLVIVDACFSGSFFFSYKATKYLLGRRSRLGMSACHSRERALDGKPGENSPFARELLRALSDNQKPLPTDQLYSQVRTAVLRATKGGQTPIFRHINVKGDDQGQYVFVPIQDEVSAWADSEKQGTIAAYQAFLERFPTGQHAEDAQAQLTRLTEEQAWEEVVRAHTIHAYLDFLSHYPDSPYRRSAQVAIEKLEDKQDWDKAKSRDAIAAYVDYTTKHPNGQYTKEAEKAINKLRNNKLTTPKEKEKPPQRERHIVIQKQVAALIKRISSKIVGLVSLLLMVTVSVVWIKSDRKKAYLIAQIEADMVRVTGGSLIMGCQDEQRDGHCQPSELPPRTVMLSDFYIGKYEVSQAQWQAVMGNNPSHNKGCDECPVEGVSWNDARYFIGKLNAITGKKYRLPTEAEWEYAARGGNRSQGFLYSGNNRLDEVAWFSENAVRGNTQGAEKTTRPVGQKRPNELGLYDMSGNIWEWVEDDWNDNYEGGPSDGSARVENPRAESRAHRGGGWNNEADYCRSARRNAWRPSSGLDFIGFRLASAP